MSEQRCGRTIRTVLGTYRGCDLRGIEWIDDDWFCRVHAAQLHKQRQDAARTQAAADALSLVRELAAYPRPVVPKGATWDEWQGRARRIVAALAENAPGGRDV